MSESIKHLLQTEDLNRTVEVKGWLRTARKGKKYSFAEINDGSSVNSLQIFIDNSLFDKETLGKLNVGACIAVKGKLVESQGKGQKVELQAAEIIIYGEADPEKYPLQKKKHSLEFLREIAHLRPRTRFFSSVMRIRNTLAFATHKFFQEREFFYIHTPIITGSDCEGAGEMFRVTTLNPENPPRTEFGNVDYSKDFFHKESFLTVSGQLNVEPFALAMSKVYTFGPTFRAEKSNTPKHLAEFWMIEPEVAFYDLQDNMKLASDYLKYLVAEVLKNNKEDLEFLSKFNETDLFSRLENILEREFIKLPYGEAIEILQKSGKNFEFPTDWGVDLKTEHERYLVEEHFKFPVIVYDYPKDIKAFYMYLNDDGKTVAAMDVLFPIVGEIIGGSQREHRYDVLMQRITEMKLNPEDYAWYLDTRLFGGAPHSGFGLGFERMVVFATGIKNIRDSIPYPRAFGSLKY